MTASPDRVLIVMPAWNEESNIGQTIRELRESGVTYDLLVVDDGSLDRTADIASAAGAIVLRLPFNMGVGGAMRTGFTYAQRHHYDAAIQFDADGQHSPFEIDRVLSGLESADISIGARFTAGDDSYVVRGPRRWAMRFLAAVLSNVTKTRLTDVTSGFRAAGPRAIDQYVRYYPSEYLGDTIDSLVAAAHHGLTVTQVPVKMRPRAHGNPSQHPIGATIYLVRSCFALSLSLLRLGRLKPTEEVP